MRTLSLLVALFAGSLISTAIAADSPASEVECSERGARFAARFKTEHVSAVSVWGNPEFRYSKPLGTCLVYTEIVDGAIDKDINAVWYSRRVTDLNSNKVVVYSRYFVRKSDAQKRETMVDLSNVGSATNLSPSDFAKAKSRLFEE